MPLFKEKCFEHVDSELAEKEMIRALGKMVLTCAPFFTVDVQPISIDGTLAYAITQYGTHDVIIVRDEDYPDMVLPEWCANDLLPLGFRKAAALTEVLHEEIVKKFNIQETEKQKNFMPKLTPDLAYRKSIGESLSITDYILIFQEKIIDNKYSRALLTILAYAVLGALGGGVLAFFTLDDLSGIRPCIYGGAIYGVFVALLEILANAISHIKQVIKQKRENKSQRQS